ncbi:hypothetical protein SAY87_015153 [Trapa incisa]|uniref:cellulase n=1 Tax=Trapa incisa TaxID=236973 RepID=A0AAN7JL73_9MYRT|nr:hypothetical protein SAY87_015153 [Trapa incisa]
MDGQFDRLDELIYVESHLSNLSSKFYGEDELLWGAAWLRRATQEDTYLNYIQANGKTLGVDEHVGLNVLVSKAKPNLTMHHQEFLDGNMYSLQSYKASADSFMCTLVPESTSSHIQYTPGCLIYKPGGTNLQHATTIAFLLLVYANYLSQTTTQSASVNCSEVSVGPASLRQVEYILGDNPKGMSYMVGYGGYYPQRIHHPGSSIPSIPWNFGLLLGFT